MIKRHSDDPDVRAVADQTVGVVAGILTKLLKAETFDYGGHYLKIGEYSVCDHCTVPIAEAQQAEKALLDATDASDDDILKEHLQLAAKLFHLEAEAAIVRAEFHNGHGTEGILNQLLGFEFERGIHDEFAHSHHGGL